MFVITTRIKNEAPYLLDWLAWHRSLGVDHIYVSANDCTDESEAILSALAGEEWLSWDAFEFSVDREHTIGKSHFRRTEAWLRGERPEYVLSLDIDEFLCLRGQTLDDLKQRLKRTGAVFLNWHNYVSGFRDEVAFGFPGRLDTRAYRVSDGKLALCYPGDLFYQNSHRVTLPDGRVLDQDTVENSGKRARDSIFIAHFLSRSAPEYFMREQRGRLNTSGVSHGDDYRAKHGFKYSYVNFCRGETAGPLRHDPILETCTNAWERERVRLQRVGSIADLQAATESRLRQAIDRHYPRSYFARASAMRLWEASPAVALAQLEADRCAFSDDFDWIMLTACKLFETGLWRKCYDFSVAHITTFPSSDLARLCRYSQRLKRAPEGRLVYGLFKTVRQAARVLKTPIG